MFQRIACVMDSVLSLSIQKLPYVDNIVTATT